MLSSVEQERNVRNYCYYNSYEEDSFISFSVENRKKNSFIISGPDSRSPCSFSESRKSSNWMCPLRKLAFLVLSVLPLSLFMTMLDTGVSYTCILLAIIVEVSMLGREPSALSFKVITVIHHVNRWVPTKTPTSYRETWGLQGFHYFSYFWSEYRLRLHIRTASLRRSMFGR